MEQHDAVFVFLAKADQHYYWPCQNNATNNAQYLPSYPTGQKFASNSNFLFTVPKKKQKKKTPLGVLWVLRCDFLLTRTISLNIPLSKYWNY